LQANLLVNSPIAKILELIMVPMFRKMNKYSLSALA